jgi:hypothetical protein
MSKLADHEDIKPTDVQAKEEEITQQVEKMKLDETVDEILLAFKQLRVKLVFLSGDIESIFKKKK